MPPARAHDSDPGCGRNHIDGLRADQAVAAAMVARLGDPRRAEHIAARLAQVREQRLGIEAEISRWEQVADDLVTKTASWGVARVDSAMAPLGSAAPAGGAGVGDLPARSDDLRGPDDLRPSDVP